MSAEPVKGQSPQILWGSIIVGEMENNNGMTRKRYKAQTAREME